MIIKCIDGIPRYSISKRLFTILTKIQHKILNTDSEYWICLQGEAGGGKSLTVQRWGYVISLYLNIKHICFDKNEFIDAIIAGQKGDTIIADEGIAIFFTRNVMTKEGRLISTLCDQIRQKNMCIIVCCVDLTTIDKLILKKFKTIANVYPSVQKIGGKTVDFKGNIDVYPSIKGKNFAREFVQWKFYEKRGKFLRKPRWAFQEKGNPIGENHKKPWYPVGEDAYREKKNSILKNYKEMDPKPTTRQKKVMTVRDKAIYELYNTSKLSHRQIAEKLGLQRTRIGEIIRDMCEMPKKSDL